MEAAARLCGVVAGEDVMAGRTRASEKKRYTTGGGPGSEKKVITSHSLKDTITLVVYRDRRTDNAASIPSIHKSTQVYLDKSNNIYYRLF